MKVDFHSTNQSAVLNNDVQNVALDQQLVVSYAITRHT